MTKNRANVTLMPKKNDPSQIWVVKKNASWSRDDFIDVGVYQILTDKGKNILEVQGSHDQNNKDDSNIIVWSKHNEPDGKVCFFPQNDGSYIIQFQNGNRVLDLAGGGSANKQNI